MLGRTEEHVFFPILIHGWLDLILDFKLPLTPFWFVLIRFFIYMF